MMKIIFVSICIMMASINIPFIEPENIFNLIAFGICTACAGGILAT